ncbi:hypothetical protein CRE_25787 [Caenorhabditis remanei]|uniref:Uncharacterized protein n=1 Tax=Caenorhabditis remanei TaxID=31234 RepID=E3N5M7_CAERE|nr:hypothetical protein CRE_25787 [Caenorhabditis remanei]
MKLHDSVKLRNEEREYAMKNRVIERGFQIKFIESLISSLLKEPDVKETFAILRKDRAKSVQALPAGSSEVQTPNPGDSTGPSPMTSPLPSPLTPSTSTAPSLVSPISPMTPPTHSSKIIDLTLSMPPPVSKPSFQFPSNE